MKIKKNASVAVVVSRTWANLQGIKRFIREVPLNEVRGPDDSHAIFARVLDADDDRGFWIELDTERDRKDPAEKQMIMIPWGEILAVVVAKKFSPAMRDMPMGFQGTVST
jgi:hypothetical protein